MWSLMVVEDEAIVRMGLKTMVRWEHFNIRWSVEASNGLEALKLFEEREVDIVITDIRMPRVDGLELARRLAAHRPELPVIMLTSFDDYAYVKEAIKLGVIDYIHKPTMNESELTEALRKAIRQLERKREMEHAAADSVTVLSPKDMNHFLLSMLDRYTLPAGWRKTWALLRLPAFERGYALVNFRLVLADSLKDEDAQTKDSLFFSVKHFMEEYISHDREGVLCARGTREIMWLCPQEDDGDEAALSEYISRMLGKLEERLHTKVTYTISQPKRDMEELPDAYLDSLLKFPKHNESLSPTIRLAKQYIERHFQSGEITLARVAEELHVSHGYLSRQFMKETGENFVDFVTRKRMAHAKKLLRGTTLKVYEIAAEVGYKNQHYFTRIFKENAGVTPLDYRKHN